MKKIFKISVGMLFVFICAGSLLAQQSSSDPTANSSSTQTSTESQAIPQQSPDASVVAAPTTTSAPTPDTQTVSSAQTSQPSASAIPEPVQQPVSSTPSASSAQPDEESLQPIQKDDKKSLTVMTSDIPGNDIEKKDWLSEVFTPVGDFAFNVVKTSSDALGGFCQGCIDAFDGITKTMLTPFGFKEEPKEKRTY